MKVKIKSFNGVLPEYLTVGKEYEVVDGKYPYFDIIDDCNENVYIDVNDCDHLNGGSWEVVEE